jgi:alpha-beta hydrolase superfamily lysophospholipase
MAPENPLSPMRAIGPQMSADVRGYGQCQAHRVKGETVRERAVLALLSEKTLVRAARHCGLNEKTLRRWIAHDEAFRRELSDARQAVFETGMSRVQAAAAHAIETLITLMGPKVPPTVRLGAAKAVADLAIQRHDADTIIRRLAEVEACQRNQESRRER